MFSPPQWASLILAPMGLLMVIFAITGYWHSYQRTSWPTTQGIMVRSRVIPISGRGWYRYYPEVEYLYTVGGRELQGERLSLEKPGEIWLKSLEERLKPLPAGARVKVYYNPSDPAQSVLEVGEFNWDDFGLLMFGLATLAGSILVFIVTRRTSSY